MTHYSYTVGELKKLIAESSQEFKPVLGPNVERDNKKNNEESYKETEKKAKDYDGGLKEPKKEKLQDKVDGNRTTLEYNPDIEPSKEYKEKVEAQAKGYTSKLEQDNGNERGGVEMDDDGRILKQFTDARDNYRRVVWLQGHTLTVHLIRIILLRKMQSQRQRCSNSSIQDSSMNHRCCQEFLRSIS